MGIKSRQKVREGVDWRKVNGWIPELLVDGESYSTYELFPNVRSSDPYKNNMLDDDQRVVSPDRRWMYCVKELPAYQPLYTLCPDRFIKSHVAFTSTVRIPALHEKTSMGEWRFSPWMSMTPMEIWTNQFLARMARGHTVVAGLGMGFLAVEVSKQLDVRKISIVERDESLCRWLLPVIEKKMRMKIDAIIIGDAWEELPRIAAEVALVDIFPSAQMLGDHEDRDRLRSMCKGIGDLYTWGGN